MSPAADAGPPGEAVGGAVRVRVAGIGSGGDVRQGRVTVGHHQLELADLPATPWRNGRGSTRVLPGAPSGWRVSVATVTDGAPFSAFPGVDRLFIPFVVGSIRLQGPGGALEADAQGCIRFDGALPVTASVPAGEALALNVMTPAGAEPLRVLRRHDIIEVLHAPLHEPSEDTP